MKRKEFNEEEIKRIEENPNVTSATRKAITFHPDFKLAAIKEHERGKLSYEIFLSHGFDLELIGKDKPKKYIHK